jgi:hypothetical protein
MEGMTDSVISSVYQVNDKRLFKLEVATEAHKGSRGIAVLFF